MLDDGNIYERKQIIRFINCQICDRKQMGAAHTVF